ncbi:hypothetical protein CDL12_28685 [Handroanthus impetiginosus]|uniref:Uncharacterized protein n=1 Tax=Handroanthus impetiginosus TaxID=429701 RepID=A0A2G9G0H2_9LAMI|nr:hypothetical protein CDL12_28685 [Handroanthus impetiginosus]
MQLAKSTQKCLLSNPALDSLYSDLHKLDILWYHELQVKQKLLTVRVSIVISATLSAKKNEKMQTPAYSIYAVLTHYNFYILLSNKTKTIQFETADSSLHRANK